MRTEADYIRSSLDFLISHKRFGTVELQRYLRCGYGMVAEVIDSLLNMKIIRIIENIPIKYERTISKRKIMEMITSQRNNIMEASTDGHSRIH